MIISKYKWNIQSHFSCFFVNFSSWMLHSDNILLLYNQKLFSVS
jgi:hypothetical protein